MEGNFFGISWKKKFLNGSDFNSLEIPGNFGEFRVIIFHNISQNFAEFSNFLNRISDLSAEIILQQIR
jgi:hypothetical protein